MRIDSAITYSVSDQIVWRVWLLEESREPDLSLDITPVDSGNTIITGRMKKLGSKEEATIELTLGFQITGAMYKIFANRLELNLEEKRTVLRMEAHCTAQGEDLPLQSGDFRVLQNPRGLNDENWIYVYKLNG